MNVQSVVKPIGPKLRFDLIPYDALTHVAAAFTHGVTKHGERDWETDGHICWAQHLFGALQRHGAAWMQGEKYDQHSGQLHTACIAANALMLLSCEIRMHGVDDRPSVSHTAMAMSKPEDLFYALQEGLKAQEHVSFTHADRQAYMALCKNMVHEYLDMLELCERSLSGTAEPETSGETIMNKIAKSTEIIDRRHGEKPLREDADSAEQG